MAVRSPGAAMKSSPCSLQLEKAHTKATKPSAARKKENDRFAAIRGNNSEKAMATHSNTLAWKIPWAEEPGRLQFIGS